MGEIKAYREKADEALCSAERSRDPGEKTLFLEIALGWLNLAQNLETEIGVGSLYKQPAYDLRRRH